MTSRNLTAPFALAALLLGLSPSAVAWAQAPAAGGAPPAAGASSAGAAREAPVTLNLRDIPLRSAFDLLFQGRGLNYAVDAAVLNPPITISITNQPFKTALRTVIRIAGATLPGLTFTQEDNLFLIKMRSAPPPILPDEAPPVEETLDVTELHWEKIPVNYNSVFILSLALGGAILPTEDQLLGSGLGGGGFGGGLSGSALGGGDFGGGVSGFGGGLFGGGLGGGLGGLGGGGLGSLGGGGLGSFGGGALGGLGGGGLGGLGGGGLGGGGFGGGGFGGGGRF